MPSPNLAPLSKSPVSHIGDGGVDMMMMMLFFGSYENGYDVDNDNDNIGNGDTQ